MALSSSNAISRRGSSIRLLWSCGISSISDAPVLIDQEGGRVVRLDRHISRSIRPARPSARCTTLTRAGLGGHAAGLPPGRPRRRPKWREFFVSEGISHRTDKEVEKICSWHSIEPGDALR